MVRPGEGIGPAKTCGLLAGGVPPREIRPGRAGHKKTAVANRACYLRSCGWPVVEITLLHSDPCGSIFLRALTASGIGTWVKSFPQ